MRVLHIEHRIVLRLLDHLGEIEIEHGVVLAIEHHEAHGVAADLVDHLAQGATEQVPLNYTMQDEHGATAAARGL